VTQASGTRFGYALLVALAAAGCGTAQAPVTWSDDMALYFSNSSVRPSDPPRHLWTQADEELLLRRLGHAECVAIGSTKVVSEYSDLSSAKQLTMAFHPQEIVHGSLEGSLDKDGDLMLQLTPSIEDFRLAVQVQRELPGTRYIAFLKRKPAPDGPVWHWALYAHDPALVTEIRAAYQLLEQQQKK